jgi:hypothetical protein
LGIPNTPRSAHVVQSPCWIHSTEYGPVHIGLSGTDGLRWSIKRMQEQTSFHFASLVLVPSPFRYNRQISCLLIFKKMIQKFHQVSAFQTGLLVLFHEMNVHHSSWIEKKLQRCLWQCALGRSREQERKALFRWPKLGPAELLYSTVAFVFIW